MTHLSLKGEANWSSQLAEQRAERKDAEHGLKFQYGLVPTGPASKERLSTPVASACLPILNAPFQRGRLPRVPVLLSLLNATA